MVLSGLQLTGVIMSPNSDRAEIEARNRLRREAKLPLLSVTAEVQHLEFVRREAEFEAFFDQERHKYVHLWSGRNLGWLTGMGVWSRVRQQVRAEFDARRNSHREE